MRIQAMLSSIAAAAIVSACGGTSGNTETVTLEETSPSPVSDVKPPIAKREAKTIEQLGRTRTDHYFWMKDDNWQDVMRDPSILRGDIRDYLVAENAYTKAVMEDPLKSLSDELFEEMRGRIKEDASSLATIDGPYAYFSKYEEGAEYPLFARRAAADVYNEDADYELLLDGDEMGKGKAYFSFRAVSHSPDHKLVAYSVDEQGSEIYTIKIRDVETGKDLPDEITGTFGPLVWNANSDALFWMERDNNGRPVAINRYALGSNTSTEIYRESDPGMFLSIGKSQSGDYIFITIADQVTSEVRYFRADDPEPSPKLIAPRVLNTEYYAEHWGDEFLIQTNDGGAVDFKIVSAPAADPGKENWSDLVPHSPGELILGMDVLKDHLIYTVRKNGVPEAIVRERTSGEQHTIAFDEPAYEMSVSTGYEFETDMIRFDYSSPSTPEQEYDYNLTTKERVLRKEQEVPSGHDREDYLVERIMAPARDGETVPVTLLRHKDTPVDGSAPMLLYGYGSYGVTISARFRTTPLALANRGMIYAIVHPRGSMAKGFQWYLDGKLKKKENTFNDYVDAGNYLAEQKYTARGKIVGMGGSAGGLLMGAVANQDPELFAGMIAAVPFVDVINTISDETLPLTPPEWPEWGNPITSAEDYDTMLAYSPYDQVSEQNYPPMLITGGLSDPRVTYWEPSKWAARLRHRAPDGGPYFLRINMEAGHGGASGRFEGLKETALEYAFALASVGKADGVSLENE